MKMPDEHDAPNGLGRRVSDAEEDEKPLLAARLKASASLLGLLQATPEEWFKQQRGPAADSVDEEQVNALIAERNAARQARDFATADRIRDELAERGIELEDVAEGTRWRVRA